MKQVHKCLILVILLSIVSCLIYTFIHGPVYNNYFYTSPVKLILFLTAPFLYYSLSKQGRFKDLIYFKGDKKYIKASLWLGAATFFFIITAFTLLNNYFNRHMILDGLAREGITKITYPYVFIYIVFINAFLEELFFRGFVFLNIFNLGYKRFAFIFSSILFSLYHIAIMNSWFSPLMFTVCLIGLIAAGIIFNELVRRCKNILGSFFLHLGANLAINLIGAYLLYMM